VQQEVDGCVGDLLNGYTEEVAKMRADVAQPGECSVQCRRETEWVGGDTSEDTSEQGGTWRAEGSRSWLGISDWRPFCTSATSAARCFLFEQHVEEGVKRVTTGGSVFGSNPFRSRPWLEKGAGPNFEGRESDEFRMGRW